MLRKPCRLQTDGQTDGRTDKVNPVYPPSNFVGRGYNDGILLIGTLRTNFSEIVIEIDTFSFKKMHLKMSYGKWWPCCLSLNVLTLKVICEPIRCHLTFWMISCDKQNAFQKSLMPKETFWNHVSKFVVNLLSTGIVMTKLGPVYSRPFIHLKSHGPINNEFKPRSS